MAGFSAWDSVAPMIDSVVGARYRDGEVWWPPVESVREALELVTAAWEKLLPPQ